MKKPRAQKAFTGPSLLCLFCVGFWAATATVLLLSLGCAGTAGGEGPMAEMGSADAAEKTQRILQQHNANLGIADHAECVAAIESILKTLTGTRYVFVDFSPEPWATGGRAAEFVPFQTRIGARRNTVTVVLGDSCRVQGLVWPE